MNKALALAAVVAVALLARAEGPDSDAAKKELERFSGTWKAVSAVRDGKEVPRDEAGKITLAVKGEKYTFRSGKETVKGKHTLDPSHKPKTIDAVRTEGPHKGEKLLGIYELTDDTFRVCFAPAGKDRPREFASKPGSGNRLFVFKRAKE